MAKKSAKNEKNVTEKSNGSAATVEQAMATPEGRMMMERAAALWGEVREASDNAAYGEVLDDAEAAVINGGRLFLRDMLEAMMMKKVREAQEATSRICEKDDCGGDIRHRGNKKKRS